jgi:hypothetical protein
MFSFSSFLTMLIVNLCENYRSTSELKIHTYHLTSLVTQLHVKSLEDM